jgi:hypothetical protein
MARRRLEPSRALRCRSRSWSERILLFREEGERDAGQGRGTAAAAVSEESLDRTSTVDSLDHRRRKRKTTTARGGERALNVKEGMKRGWRR